jgi:hypothetical protein
MESNLKKIRYSEIGLLVFVWVVLLMTPILFREDNNHPVVKSVLNQLEILIPLTLVFLINRFLLVPRLLFKGRVPAFIASVLIIICIMAFCSYIYNEKIKQNLPLRPEQTENIQPAEYPRSENREANRNENPSEKRQPRPVPPFANFLILSILVVGFDTGLLSGLRWILAEDEKVRLEKEKVSTQLTLLRSQISPHFFMNTLNNIHALVDSNTSEAKEAIIKLSKMMRYLLYETDSEKTTLKKEVEFLESYINLMKLRFSDKVKISLNLPDRVPDVSIPPFLFISFIENAFKHGISYRDESSIGIDLIPGKDKLLFVVRNRKNNSTTPDEFSGIGIENTRKRLDLLYGDRYNLLIIDNEEVFTVNLTLPL